MGFGSPGAVVDGVLAWRYGAVSNANRGVRRRCVSEGEASIAMKMLPAL